MCAWLNVGMKWWLFTLFFFPRFLHIKNKYNPSKMKGLLLGILISLWGVPKNPACEIIRVRIFKRYIVAKNKGRLGMFGKKGHLKHENCLSFGGGPEMWGPVVVGIRKRQVTFSAWIFQLLGWMFRDGGLWGEILYNNKLKKFVERNRKSYCRMTSFEDSYGPYLWWTIMFSELGPLTLLAFFQKGRSDSPICALSNSIFPCPPSF